MLHRLLASFIALTIICMPCMSHAKKKAASEDEVTTEEVTTEDASAEETATTREPASYSSSSNTASVGNYAIKIGPMGNIYIVDSNTELSPGVGGFVAFDYRFHPKFSLEAGIFATLQDGSGISGGDNNILLLGIPTVDIKYYFLADSRWDPYTVLGFGCYTLTEGSNDNGSTAFGIGANLGLGVDYYVTSHFSLGLAATFRAIAFIESIGGDHNGSSLFPFSMAGNAAYHF
jgi:outer membrane protein W